MNSENSLQLNSQTTNHSSKIATRRISKQITEKIAVSEKAAKNIKRNSTRKTSKVLNNSQIMEDTLMSEIKAQNVDVETINQEILEKVSDQLTNFISAQTAEEFQNSSFEENHFQYRTPGQSNSRYSRRHSQDNDFSDRETVEETVSCFSEHNGSQTKSEFDQDFTTIFSSNNTTPIKKQGSQDFISLTDTKTEKERSIEEELANFNPEINPCAFDSETIMYLIKREEDYAVDPHYLGKKQTEINWSMRAILLDWMNEVSMEFCLKRETFYYAINFLDRYLSTVENIPKSDLQLVGVTALYMASKIEEVHTRRVATFAKATDSAYNEQQILEMEIKMAKALKWMLTPPTMSTWANWYMNQWDLYIERSEFAQGHPLVMACGDDLIQFKQSNQKSYVRFREMMQIIDCITLDAKTNPLTIVAQNIAAKTRLLCFDEFQVTDIGDALIMKNLFQSLFLNNVVLVATSNRPPEDLYYQGLQRHLFVPFIDILKAECKIININSPTDYRLTFETEEALKASTFLEPNNHENNKKLDRIFKSLSKEEGHPMRLKVMSGREIEIPKVANSVALFDFMELCDKAYGSMDFIAICRSFNSIILKNVPEISLTNKNLTRRFILLIDEIYNHKVKLYVSATKPLLNMFRVSAEDGPSDEMFAMERCKSRLMEMQSHKYMEEPSYYNVKLAGEGLENFASQVGTSMP